MGGKFNEDYVGIFQKQDDDNDDDEDDNDKGNEESGKEKFAGCDEGEERGE